MSAFQDPAAARTLEAVPPTVPAGLVVRDLKRRLATLVRAARRLRRGDDADAAHDVRVASRRLDATLELWTPVLDGDAVRRLRKRLGRMRRAAARLRDLEAGAALLRALAPELKGPVRESAEAFALRLSRRVPKATRRARPAMRASRRRALRDLLADATAPLRDRPGAPGRRAVPVGGARERVAALAHRVSDALRDAVEDDTDEALHEARLALKRQRYAAESLASVDRLEAHAERDGARDLQRSLGRVQDLVTLARRVERRAAKLRARGRDAGGLEALHDALRAARAQAVAAVQELVSTGNGVGAPRAF